MSRPTREQVLAWAAALTPLAVSLAGNVTWGVTTGSPILIAAGIVTPLLLVLAIERWRSMPTATGAQWWVRTIAMGGVVVVVAGWSWLHTTALLLDEVEALHPAPPVGVADTILRAAEVVLCVLAPLAVDGLAVLSVLALDAGRAASRVAVRVPVRVLVRPDGVPVRPDPAGQSFAPGGAGTAEPGSPEPGEDHPGDETDTPDPAGAGTGDRDATAGTWSDEQVLADLAERGESAPTVHALRTRYGMRYPRAKRLVGELAQRADRSGPRRNGHAVGASPGG